MSVEVFYDPKSSVKPEPKLDLKDLISAFKEVLQRAEVQQHHTVKFEAISVRERMSQLLERMQHFSEGQTVRFEALFSAREGKMASL